MFLDIKKTFSIDQNMVVFYFTFGRKYTVCLVPSLLFSNGKSNYYLLLKTSEHQHQDLLHYVSVYYLFCLCSHRMELIFEIFILYFFQLLVFLPVMPLVPFTRIHASL